MCVEILCNVLICSLFILISSKGCFWHIQHEFVEAERKLLGRGDAALTSRTGYAGGTQTDKEGRVSYYTILTF